MCTEIRSVREGSAFLAVTLSLCTGAMLAGLVGCTSGDIEPVARSESATVAQLSQPEPEQGPWQLETELGQLMVGNRFPGLQNPKSLFDLNPVPKLEGANFVIVLNADMVNDEPMESWEELVGQFGDAFKFVFVSDSGDRERWADFEGLIADGALSIVQADNATTENVSQEYLLPSLGSYFPQAFIVGTDSHIEWIKSVVGADFPDKLKNCLVSVKAGNWDRELVHAKFEEENRVGRAGRRVSVAVSLATENEDYDSAISLLQKTMVEVPEIAVSTRSQLSYLASRAKRNDVLNDIIASQAKDKADDAEWLGEKAYQVAVGQEGDDPKLAIELATQACEVTEYKDARMLYTLAFAKAKNGEADSAIDWVLKARGVSEDTDFQKGAEEMIEALPGITLPPQKALSNGSEAKTGSLGSTRIGEMVYPMKC